MTEAQTLMASLFPTEPPKPQGGGITQLLIDLHITHLTTDEIRTRAKGGTYAPAKMPTIGRYVLFARPKG